MIILPVREGIDQSREKVTSTMTMETSRSRSYHMNFEVYSYGAISQIFERGALRCRCRMLALYSALHMYSSEIQALKLLGRASWHAATSIHETSP